MSFVIYRKHLSANYDSVQIPVEFMVIHYTSAGLTKTIDIFQDPQSNVSCHFVVDEDGATYELVPCIDGTCFKAWHAGDSRWEEEKKTWKQFNDFSIGVELVNKNGNIFQYTQKQYDSLKSLLEKLKASYPALRKPDRILGHEHIAGYRGKVDPGHCFDWPLFFKMNNFVSAPLRKAVLSEKNRQKFMDIALKLSAPTDEEWMQISQKMESAASLKE